MRAEDWVDVDSVLRAAQGRWPSILHALGVDPAYLRNKHGPCPLCGGKDRYRFDDRDGAGTWICSHCGAGTGPQLIEHLKGIGFIEAVKAVCNVLPMATQPAPQCPAGDVWERLRRIWRESAPVTCDDAVARYLEARRVWGPYPYPADIRCHPALGYYEDAKRIATYPAMVALVRGPDGKGRSLHVTYLDPKGGKARVNSARKLLAPTGRGGAIRLSARVEGDMLVATVRDDGMGIAPDQLGSIFELFVQLDRSLERNQGGLGIGLTLVRRLLELHGGNVVAESAGLGHGSRFIVRLPRIAPPVESPGAAPGEAAPAPAPALRHRVLVVDDNRDNAESLALLLQLAGHELHEAYDGAEAIALAERHRPDAIVLDIGLPGMNGYEACRRIRELRPEYDPLIIALTGWGQEDDRRRSAEAGFDAHLVKPVDHLELSRTVSRVAAMRAGRMPRSAES
jgi:CheY-like chemotaxis protein